jgi:hypothetical protein
MSEHDDYADHDLPPPGLLTRLGSRRKLWSWLTTLTGMAALIGVVMLAAERWDGVGFYDQTVILETDRAVRGVTYTAENLDADLRRLAEDSADPKYFDCRPVALRDGKWFAARVMFDESGGPLRRTRVSHQPHLVVYVEFEDGSRACRIVDLPPGIRGPPITILIP